MSLILLNLPLDIIAIRLIKQQIKKNFNNDNRKYPFNNTF